jgi:hypothetical protein
MINHSQNGLTEMCQTGSKNNMKLLIIGDVHLHYEKAERICRRFKNYKIVFVGDYFDQFHDSPEENEWCAEWLKESMSKPDRIHLRGNHDEHYDPRVKTYCSGFSISKKARINKVLTIEDWDKLKYFHYEHGWWISHAGISEYWFNPPIHGGIINTEIVQKTIDASIVKQRIGEYENAIWAADAMRGGRSEVGGLLWADWRTMKNICPNGLNQVVGHTPVEKILVSKLNDKNCTIVNVDCSAITKLCEVLMIDDDGKYDIIDTSSI